MRADRCGGIEVMSICVLITAALLCPCGAYAVPPAPQGDAQFWDAYWRGLLLMREAKWGEASAAFAQASQRAPGDGRVYLAKGVTGAITGDFNTARADLQRARFVKSREPKLWEYAVDAMTGTSGGDRGIPIPRSLQQAGQPTTVFGGVPGHMIQGGDDYTTAYASALVYELAVPYGEARAARRATDTPQLEAARRKVGRWFANRMLATQELASRNYGMAMQLFRAGRLREARDILDIARTVYPFDADMAALSGDVWLKAGRPATAREHYTVALTMQTNHAGAYTGRAESAAMMGDARTAEADMAHATRYGGGAPAGLKQRVEALLGESRVDADPSALLGEMDKAAASGATVEALTPLAIRVHRAAAGRRVRYDELYQDTIRKLEDAIRADKAAVGPRVELAQYLHDEVDVRGAEVEPRRGLTPFRWQHTRQLELGRAMHYVDHALRIDARHVPALITKAYVLRAIGRDADAERFIDAAVKLTRPDDGATVRLLAMYRRRQINGMLAAAAGLRMTTYSTSTHYENRSDGVWKVTTTTRHEPTDAELARAAALERQARAMMAEMRTLMDSALKVSRGTLDGLLLESTYEDWFGSRNKALALLGQAVREHPRALKAHDALIEYLRFLAQHETAMRQEAVSWQLFETTCAPLLRLTWRNIREQGWAAHVDELTKARLLDPTDARATAYLAAARKAMGDSAGAVALLKVGSALERARIEQDDRGEALAWPRPADDMAGAMQMRQDLADMLKGAGRGDEALGHYVASGELALRYPPDGVAAQMYTAMRPDADHPGLPAPAPVNGATLASRAHLGAAEALKAAGRVAEARVHYEAAARHVRPHDSTTPNIEVRTGDNNFGGFAEGASATALMELAKQDIAAERYQDAYRKLQDASQAKPTSEQRREINQMMLKILPHLNNR